MNKRFAFTSLALSVGITCIEHGVSSLAIAQEDARTGQALQAPHEGADLEGLEVLLNDPVVTTASRSAERASTAPSSVYTITAKELQTFGIRTIDEALGYLGLGVYTASTRDYTTGIDVGAQGVLLRDRGRHMLGLVDGHVMNSQAFGGISIHEAFGVPLEAIDHIEVMLGAGSVMYGSNAMLLVVNVVTRRASVRPGGYVLGEIGSAAPQNGGGIIGRTGDERFGLRYRVGASGRTTLGERADLMVSAEWLEERSNTYQMGPYSGMGIGPFEPDLGETEWGGLAHHRMIAPSGILTARYDAFRLLMQANHYERDMPLVGTFQARGSKEKQDALRFDLRHSADLGTHATLGSRLYADYHRFSESSSWSRAFSCLPGQDSGCWFQMDAIARGMGFEQQLVVDWRLDGALSTTFGFDARGRSTESTPADYRDSATGVRSTAVRTPHHEQLGFLGAVFAQQIWKPTSSLTLNLGARLDADTDFERRISPRAAVTLEPADGSSIRASYSEAFRGPTPYELDETDLVYRIAPGSLKPEVVRAVELDWQQRLASATFSVRGYGFYYSDFIDTRPATAEEFAAASPTISPLADRTITIVNDNVSTIRSFGITPSLALRPAPGLEIAGMYNFSHTRRDGQPLAVIPEAFGNMRVAWQPMPDGVTIAAAAIVAGERRVIANVIPTDERIGRQFDLRTTLSGPTGFSGLEFRASLSYVHNAALPYTPVIPGTAEPGEPLLLSPATTRLHGFLGLRYGFLP